MLFEIQMVVHDPRKVLEIAATLGDRYLPVFADYDPTDPSTLEAAVMRVLKATSFYPDPKLHGLEHVRTWGTYGEDADDLVADMLAEESGGGGDSKRQG